MSYIVKILLVGVMFCDSKDEEISTIVENITNK